MFAGIVKTVYVLICLIVFVTSFVDGWHAVREEEQEYDAFEQRRADRQDVFDQHAVDVAHWMLMQDAAQIHFVGEARHDR